MMRRMSPKRFTLIKTCVILLSAALFQLTTMGSSAESHLREASTSRAASGWGFWQRLRAPTPVAVVESRPLGYAVARHEVHRVFRAFHQPRRVPLGAPVSGAMYERGHLVQYFEHARLAWYPEHLADRRVVCHMGIPLPGATPTVVAGRRGPTPVPTVVSSELGPLPRLRVACAYPQPGRGGTQVATATLVAPDGRPVADVPVKITVHQAGSSMVLGPELSGPRGEVTQRFAIGSPPSCTTVYVDAEFLWGQSVVRARTSYLVWY